MCRYRSFRLSIQVSDFAQSLAANADTSAILNLICAQSSLEVAMKLLRHTMPLLLLVAVSPAAAQTTAPPFHAGPAHAIYQKFQDLKWEKLIPELGAASAEITILNVDPISGATQLMIRSPKNYHAPKHWHTANETHTVISGTFIMQHDGGAREELGPGSYNRMPSMVIHEAWSKLDEGNLVFITVDGPWDLNLVDGPTGKMPPTK
jgi:quercetin dioxygenase-like cupin family protein